MRCNPNRTSGKGDNSEHAGEKEDCQPAPRPGCLVQSYGRVPYARGRELQREAVAAVAAGGEDRLILLEHDPVLTIGRSGSETNLLASEETLRREGIELYRIERGGDITYHGPGQLVGYPILNLERQGHDLHRLLRNYEEAAIGVLAAFGLAARRDPKYTGVWVGEEKIMAIGVAVKRWVSYHGFAFNIDPNLDHFKLIRPCGIRDKGVTSLARLLGRAVRREEVEPLLIGELGRVFGLTMHGDRA